MGSLSLLQGIFLTQELNRGVLHCRKILYQLSYQGSPLCIYYHESKYNAAVSNDKSHFNIKALLTPEKISLFSIILIFR